MHFGFPPRVANGNSDIDPAFCVCVCMCVGNGDTRWMVRERVCTTVCLVGRYAPANFARFRPCAASTGEEKVYSS